MKQMYRTGFGLLLLCLPTGAQAGAARGICGLVADLNAFIAAKTEYAPPPCPEIGFSLPLPTDAARSQAGAYLPETGQIELAPDLDLTSAYGQSYLLHELVHAAQYAGGRQHKVACIGALEAEAYAVQAQFLRAHDLGREATLITLLGAQLGQCSAEAEY